MQQLQCVKKQRCRGLSLVELLVGVAVGLFVVVGAVKLAVENLSSNRRLLAETRLNQDLRTATDVIARDLRRASYWDAASTGLWSAGATTVSAVNPYTSIDTSTAGKVVYSYQRPNVDPSAASPTLLGFWLDGGVLKIQDAASGWQPLTDPNASTITALTITAKPATVELSQYCSCLTKLPHPAGSSCTSAAALQALSTSPRLIIRQYDIVVTGTVPGSSAVQRQIRETVRVRNDELRNPNGCPVS